MSLLAQFPLEFPLQYTRFSKLLLFSVHFCFFLRTFFAKYAESGRGVAEVGDTRRSASFPIRSWFLTTYKCPSQLLAANHGRRYVFSQPILDHICTGNASHLENSRPGANGRRVTPAVDTTTWHSETASLPQSRSSITQTRKKKFTLEIPCGVSDYSQPSRFAIPSPCQLVVHQLCLASFAP